MPASISDRVRVKRSSCVAVREQPERAAALDDRQAPPGAGPCPSEVGDGRVAGLVRRDGLAVGVGVDDGCFIPISSVNFASITSSKFISRRPSRRAISSDSSKRCSIITGV